MGFFNSFVIVVFILVVRFLMCLFCCSVLQFVVALVAVVKKLGRKSYLKLYEPSRVFFFICVSVECVDNVNSSANGNRKSCSVLKIETRSCLCVMVGKKLCTRSSFQGGNRACGPRNTLQQPFAKHFWDNHAFYLSLPHQHCF